MLRQLGEQSQTFLTTVGQLRVKDWVNNGASDSYVRQQGIVRDQAGYLKVVAGRLAEEPEKLSLVLDAYFRLQAMETYSIALADAAAKYQDGQASQQMRDLISRNSEAAGKLRQYMMDLSVTKEQEYSTVEKEAHRCQAMLNQPPPPQPVVRPATKGKK